ncbi:Ger(x)C family spore germination C-terminal domain-containing protein, partial [Aeromonas veronii]|nr:Ger(x)C family spore germination C-terminal domain-containing protein [Aeromonas veronii]
EVGGGMISIDIIKAEVKTNPYLEDNEIIITVDISTEMNVMENDSKVKLDDPNVIEELQKNVESDIKDRIQSVIDIVQKDFQSDIFGFGQAIYKKYPQEWNSKYKQNWEQEFSNIEVAIQPKVFIRRTGLSK